MLRLMLSSLKIVTIVVTALMVALGGRWFFDFYMDREADPNVGRPVRISIEEADDADKVADELVDKDLIRSELYFKTRLQVSGNQLQPGDYTLRIGMSTAMILDEITVPGVEVAEGDSGDDGQRRAAEAQTIEGERLEQIAARVESAADEAGIDGYSAEAFLQGADEIEDSQFEGLLDSRPRGASLEGYLFPAKYPFDSNGDAKDLVYYMLEILDQQFTPEMRERAAEMGWTIHEVLTLASIVEKETSIAEERPVVASVYLNRLAAPPEEFLPLQADPTVAYVIGDESDWWPVLEGEEIQSDEADSPYNTYVYEGLPPGPICSPGLDAIKAVLYPSETDYLYFVANPATGEHLFSVTYEEHLQKTAELDAADPGGG